MRIVFTRIITNSGKLTRKHVCVGSKCKVLRYHTVIGRVPSWGDPWVPSCLPLRHYNSTKLGFLFFFCSPNNRHTNRVRSSDERLSGNKSPRSRVNFSRTFANSRTFPNWTIRWTDVRYRSRRNRKIIFTIRVRVETP